MLISENDKEILDVCVDRLHAIIAVLQEAVAGDDKDDMMAMVIAIGEINFGAAAVKDLIGDVLTDLIKGQVFTLADLAKVSAGGVGEMYEKRILDINPNASFYNPGSKSNELLKKHYPDRY